MRKRDSLLDVHTVVTKLRDRRTVPVLFLFFLMPAFALLAEMNQTLNAVGLAFMFLLFILCVLLISVDELPAFYRFTLWVVAFGFLLNTWYELLHSIFYTHFTEPGYTYLELVYMIIESAIGDSFISLGLLFSVTLFRQGKWNWARPWARKDVLFVVVLALGIQVVVELVALDTGAWAYNEAMPLVPLLNVGLTPLLQMPLLILPTFWLAHRVARSPSETNVCGSPKHI